MGQCDRMADLRPRRSVQAHRRTAWPVSWLVALALTGCGTPSPERPAIVPATAWGGLPASATLSAPQQITHLTVHHQGELWQEGADVPAYLRRLQRWSREAKGWPDVPYHYIVAPDGTVYAGRSPALPGDTNTEYDPQGHLQVMLLGNFEVQSPTAAQWRSTVRLLAQLLAEHRLAPAALGAHRHHSTQTVCPGANLFARFDELRAAVAAEPALAVPARAPR